MNRILEGKQVTQATAISVIYTLPQPLKETSHTLSNSSTSTLNNLFIQISKLSFHPFTLCPSLQQRISVIDLGYQRRFLLRSLIFSPSPSFSSPIKLTFLIQLHQSLHYPRNNCSPCHSVRSVIVCNHHVYERTRREDVHQLFAPRRGGGGRKICMGKVLATKKASCKLSSSSTWLFIKGSTNNDQKNNWFN